jgi:Tfp pilus assembly protein PilE
VVRIAYRKVAEALYWAEVSRIRSNEKQPKSGFWKSRIERRNLTPGIERLVTPNPLPIKNRSAETAQAGCTIVEMIVVVTVIGFLAAVALGAHAKVANDAKIIKYKALISTLTIAKSAWLADPARTARDVQTFNAAPEANFAMIAPYIRLNGAQPTNEQHLLSLSALPDSVRTRLGTVDDSSFGGQNSDQAPTVSGKEKSEKAGRCRDCPDSGAEYSHPPSF